MSKRAELIKAIKDCQKCLTEMRRNLDDEDYAYLKGDSNELERRAQVVVSKTLEIVEKAGDHKSSVTIPGDIGYHDPRIELQP